MRRFALILSLLLLAACGPRSTVSHPRAGGTSTLRQETMFSDVIEDPPAENSDPKVTPEQALQLAHASGDEKPPNISVDDPILVLFTDTGKFPVDGGDKQSGPLIFDHVLAWDVHEHGCFPVTGAAPTAEQPSPPQPSPFCGVFHVVIDANTGDFILAFNWSS